MTGVGEDGLNGGPVLRKVLTIAGSDCSGGAGIQADLKTIAAHGMYGMSAITALTAQNTTGVYGVLEASADFVGQQIDCVFDDIRPDAVKIGMVANADIISTIADRLRRYEACNVVVDPVMVSTSGCRLIGEDAGEALVRLLLPCADIITPNMPEAAALCGFPVVDAESMTAAARAIGEMTPGAVLVKGGHAADTADDLLVLGDGQEVWLRGRHVPTVNTHGTGCTLSSAIACELARGARMEEAVAAAKRYLTGALEAGLDLGRGPGPLDHLYLQR